MSKLNLFLALAALGLAGYVAVGSSSSNDSSSEDLQARLSSLEASVASVETQLKAMNRRDHNDPLTAMRDDSAAGARTSNGPTSNGPTLSGTPKSDTSTTDAASSPESDMKEELARVKEELAKLKKNGGLSLPKILSSATSNGFFRNTNDLATKLELDDGQKADIEDILAEAKEDLDELMDEPNEDGDTMRSVREEFSTAMKDMMAKRTGGSGTMTTFNSSDFQKHFQRMSSFKDSRLPSHNKTYREAANEIRNRAFGRVGSTMTDDQRRKWDSGHKHGLLPGSGGMSTTVTVGTPSIFVESTESDSK